MAGSAATGKEKEGVVNLYTPWPKRIAGMLGDVVSVDVDGKGYAFGEFLRDMIWLHVNETLGRWVVLELAKTKEKIFYDVQYENLPYYYFSCGLRGHSEIYYPTPASRDEYGHPPYNEKLRAQLWNKS